MSVAASRPPAPLVAPAPLPVPTPADREPGSPPFAELLRQSRGVERRSTEAPKATTDASRTATRRTRCRSGAASDETVPANDSAPKSDAGRARARAAATTRAARRARRHRPSGPTEPEQIAERGAQDDDPRRPPLRAAPRIPIPLVPIPPGRSTPTSASARRTGRRRLPPREATPTAGAASTSGTAVDSGVEPDSLGRRNGTEAVGRSDTGRGASRARDGDAVDARDVVRADPRRRQSRRSARCRRGLGRAAAAARRRHRRAPQRLRRPRPTAPSPPRPRACRSPSIRPSSRPRSACR